MLVRRILRRISPRICGLQKSPGDGIGCFSVRHDDYQKISGFSFVKKNYIFLFLEARKVDFFAYFSDKTSRFLFLKKEPNRGPTSSTLRPTYPLKICSWSITFHPLNEVIKVLFGLGPGTRGTVDGSEIWLTS